MRWREGPPSRDAARRRRASTAAGCRRSRSSTAGCARRSSSAPATCRTSCPASSRLALPQSDGTFVTSSKPLRPGDSYQARVYVPHPTDSQLRALGHQLPGLHPGLPRAAGAAARRVRRPRRPGHRAAAGLQRRHALRRLRHRRRGAASCGRAASASSRTATSVMADSPYAQLYALTQQIRRDHALALRLRAGRPATACSGARPTTRTRRGARYPLASFLFDTKTRLLPAVLRRDGADAAHGRGPRPRGVGLQPRQLQQRAQGLRGARHRRALVGRGLLPALRLDHLRPDARRLAGQLAARRRRRRAPPAGRRCRRTSAAAWASPATARSRPATPAPASRPPSGGGGWKLPVGAGVVGPPGARWRGVVLWRRRTPVRARSRPSWPSCSARCTAPGATRRPT